MTETVAIALWQRLDTPGHDSCRLQRRADGWRLAGTALFRHEGRPCVLTYSVDCDTEWRTLSANVSGWLGFDEINLDIAATSGGGWLLNGLEQTPAQGCIDVDLGFTPATNLIAIRRLNPPRRKNTPAPAAYLAFPELRLDRLDQTYRRTGENAFAYAAPVYDYAETLEAAPVGFVTNYPGLWTGTVSSPEAAATAAGRPPFDQNRHR